MPVTGAQANPEFARNRNSVGGALLPTDPPEFQRFIGASRPLELAGIDWDAIPSHSVPDDVLTVLAYMQDVESQTVIFPRTIFSQRAVDDEIVGTFLICWLYEEGMHGRELATGRRWGRG